MRRIIPWLAALATVATVSAALGAGGAPPVLAAPTAVAEKEVNLDEALRLADLLRARGVDVVLTRQSDADVGLVERARTAGSGDLLLSVHNNASTDRTAQGSEVYYQVGNGSGGALARRILSGVAARAGTRARGVFAREGEHGDYYSVLRNTRATAVIVEGAFISNPREASLLADAAFRQRLAEGMADGVMGYLATFNAGTGSGPPPERGVLGGGHVLAAPGHLAGLGSGDRSFHLSWDPVLLASGYEVWRDGALVATTAAPGFDDSVVALGAHTYQVRAVLDVLGIRTEESPSSAVTVASGRVVIDPGHGGSDPGAIGSF